MSSHELFQAGQLNEAIDAAIADVKKHPSDTGKRAFFCELLCFAGDLERADKQLDLLSTQLPESAMQVALFRQLIRAEQARRDFYTSGRVPEFIGEPTTAQSLSLQASIELREQNLEAATELIGQAEEARVRVSGMCDGNTFDDFRDLDDLLAPTVEVLTSTGRYFWIAPERIESMELHPVETPRDLLWRPAAMSVQGGPDGVVYIPVVYFGDAESSDDALKLGRATDWIEHEDEGPVLGRGQRTFLIGEDDRPILSLTELTFGQSE